ncbi:hypothetical protein Tsp_07697 [Trichinella spiralis]|uniref:hypothetical protein n=1 Tax=Trichinella spiralis TaxID=6334 RepID=UPI0001EFC61E|nr:hypothetical protein Tsp_07697 [Trichinella spiralis]
MGKLNRTMRSRDVVVAYHVPCADGCSESRENDDALMTMRIHRIVISEAMHCRWMLIGGAVDVVNTLMTCVENFLITYKALRNDVSSWGRFSTPACGRYLPTT